MGVAGWMLEKTIELDRLLSVEPGRRGAAPTILGFVEEHNKVLLCTDIGAFMVNLHSMQFKKLSQTMEPGFYHPFTSFYTKVIPCQRFYAGSWSFVNGYYLLCDNYCSFKCLMNCPT
jgi:hypothetical protein